jgi:hypothetical protein
VAKIPKAERWYGPKTAIYYTEFRVRRLRGRIVGVACSHHKSRMATIAYLREAEAYLKLGHVYFSENSDQTESVTWKRGVQRVPPSANRPSLTEHFSGALNALAFDRDRFTNAEVAHLSRR